MTENNFILTMLVENEAGVVARVAGLFAGRGYNIESICGAPTHDPKLSRITIKTKTHPEQLERIIKQLNRLINVIKLREVTGETAVQREMALIWVNAKHERSEILRIVKIFRAKIVDTGIDHFIIEVTGREEKIDAIIQMLSHLGIKKVARTGPLALIREQS